MERLFQILAVVFAGIAAFFLWKGNNDGMFISAVAGAVCFFLSIRFQVKERMKQREAEGKRQKVKGKIESGSHMIEEQLTTNHEQRTTDKVL